MQAIRMRPMGEQRTHDRSGPYPYRGKTLYEWMPAVVERIVENFDPFRIIVFGSVARGDANYDSDIDLLIVFDEVEWAEKRNVTVEIRRTLADFPVPKDIVVTDVNEIRRRGHLVGPILRPALEEGRVVYERP